MDGAQRAQSAQLLRELIAEARQIEDEAWRAVADLRRSACDGQDLMRAIHLLEKATAHRTRLDYELKEYERKA
ncbi:MAG TPA: hypothetical protein VIL30_17610 [Ramlibacter sp.]